MKKQFSMLIATTLVAAAIMATPASAATMAKPTASNVLVNGVSKSFDAYNIDGSNYFKLRDLAYVLNGTEKQFEVTWDAEKNAINMLSKTAYTAAGGELTKGDGTEKAAEVTNSAIYVNGVQANLSAYNIGGNNYFKLRDVMQIFDVAVGWDAAANTITLNSASGYAEAEPSAPAQPQGNIVELPVGILNKTGVTIYELYLSPANSDVWGEDLLGDKVLIDGETDSYILTIDKDTLKWDVMIKDSVGTAIELYGLDFSESSVEGAVILLEYDAATTVGTATIYTQN